MKIFSPLIIMKITNGTIPIRVNRSANISPFILRSKGASILSDGEKLTSKSQGFKNESTKTSNPNNEKQLDLNGTFISQA